MRKISFYLFCIIPIALLLSGCNWDVIGSEALNVDRNPASESSTATFNGAAPRNLRVSQAAYSDRITLSFSSVQHADLYRIYRAEVPADYVNNGIYDDSLYWMNIAYLETDEQGSILYSDYSVAEDSNTEGKAYLYVVQAGNDYAELFLGITPKFSNVEKGWILTPPQNVSADQGIAVDYIRIMWSGVENVKGYDIQYSYDKIDWMSAYSSIIPPISSGDNTFYFYPDKADYGKQIYFRVVSAQSNSKSTPSVVRIGYTFVEGAPQVATGVTASKAEYGDKIVIQWDIPVRESQTGGGYTWEVTRMTAGAEETVVASFNSEEDLPDGVFRDEEAGVYRYEDRKGLTEGKTYEYSVKASCLVSEEGSGSVLLPGPAARVEGYLLSPPSEFTTSVDYASKIMSISVSAPLGFNQDRNWAYRVEGRLNRGTAGTGSWAVVEENVPVKENVELTYDFDIVKANEFRFTLVSGAVSSIASRIVAPDEMKNNDFEVKPNIPPSDTSLANNNGLYPVVYSMSPDSPGIILTIEVDRDGDRAADASVTVDSADISSAANTITESPEELFVKYSYRARKENPFGRVSEWTAWQNGWGALTNEAFIDMMEMWILKPWEFRDQLPSDLRSKWAPDKNGEASNKMAYKILNPGIDSQGDVTAPGKAGGTIRYFTGGVDIWNMAADITFVYQAFGERDEVHGTGQYVMKGAKMSGSGSGVTGTLNIISDMYPGIVDFNSLNTRDQKFTGNYLVRQEWSSVYEEVSSN